MGHNGLVGMRYHRHGLDWAELALDQRNEILGDDGIVAAGPILTTVDMVLSLAVWLKAGRFRPQATLDLRVDWVRRPECGRTIYARGECHDDAGGVSFVRGGVHDGDPARAVAHVVGSYIPT